MNIAFGNHAFAAQQFMRQEGILADEYTALPWDRLRRQCMNIKDENAELDQAIAQNDQHEVRDALCDIRVFALGAAHYMGWDICKDRETIGVSPEEAGIIQLLTPWLPHVALVAGYIRLMHNIENFNYTAVQSDLRVLLEITELAALKLGIAREVVDADMKVVVAADMSRFIKDEADRQATIAMHAAKGVSAVYFEGTYPTCIMKSAIDQPDAPKGKFLKSASNQQPEFAPLTSFNIQARCHGDR
jgi:hypothetical protein